MSGRKPLEFRSVFISDTHMITSGCEAERLGDFLDRVRCENLILVGDIIDGWRARNSFWRVLGLGRNKLGLFCDKHQVRVFKKILSKVSKCNVYYVLGNHDDFLEEYIDSIKEFGNLKVCRELEFNGLAGKKYIVLHGHQFDGVIQHYKFIAFLADYSNSLLMTLSRFIQRVRKWLGCKKRWSLSYAIKHKVKQGVEMIYNLEHSLLNYCLSRNCDGVIFGHTHYACMKEVEGVPYMNCGDWVDSCTAIVEHTDGTFELLRYDDEKWH